MVPVTSRLAAASCLLLRQPADYALSYDAVFRIFEDHRGDIRISLNGDADP
jgi:hypothetical protein